MEDPRILPLAQGPQLLPGTSGPADRYRILSDCEDGWVVVVRPGTIMQHGTVGCLAHRRGPSLSGYRRVRVVRVTPTGVLTQPAPLAESSDLMLQWQFLPTIYATREFNDLINPFVDPYELRPLADLVAARLDLEDAIEVESADELMRLILDRLDQPEHAPHPRSDGEDVDDPDRVITPRDARHTSPGHSPGGASPPHPANGLGIATAALYDRVLQRTLLTTIEVAPAPELPDHAVVGVSSAAASAFLSLLRLCVPVLAAAHPELARSGSFLLTISDGPVDPFVGPCAGALMVAVASALSGRPVRPGVVVAAALSLRGRLVATSPLPDATELISGPILIVQEPGDGRLEKPLVTDDPSTLLQAALSPAWDPTLWAELWSRATLPDQPPPAGPAVNSDRASAPPARGTDGDQR